MHPFDSGLQHFVEFPTISSAISKVRGSISYCRFKTSNRGLYSNSIRLCFIHIVIPHFMSSVSPSRKQQTPQSFALTSASSRSAAGYSPINLACRGPGSKHRKMALLGLEKPPFSAIFSLVIKGAGRPLFPGAKDRQRWGARDRRCCAVRARRRGEAARRKSLRH